MNTAFAQSTPPVSPSVSASAPTDKGVGYGQITKDGRKYENLTEKEVDGLSDAEYDTYQKWKIAQKKAKIIAIEEKGAQIGARIIAIEEKGAQIGARIIAIQEENAQLEATIVSKYNMYIDAFTRLHSLQGRA